MKLGKVFEIDVYLKDGEIVRLCGEYDLRIFDNVYKFFIIQGIEKLYTDIISFDEVRRIKILRKSLDDETNSADNNKI